MCEARQEWGVGASCGKDERKRLEEEGEDVWDEEGVVGGGG